MVDGGATLATGAGLALGCHATRGCRFCFSRALAMRSFLEFALITRPDAPPVATKVALRRKPIARPLFLRKDDTPHDLRFPEKVRQVSECPNKGHKASPETIARMSESHKGNTGRLGQPLSEEHRAKIGATQVGKILSSETRTRMSEAKKESWRKAKEIGRASWRERV